MDLHLKSISKGGFAEAIAKVELYRYLNEPEEAESICLDILAVDSEHQLARRLLGLTITDQFTGAPGDRYTEVERIFHALRDPYERLYYTGLLHERRVKAQLRAGRPAYSLVPLLEEAMSCFAEAEKIRPQGNDDAILRWNSCVRLLHAHTEFAAERPVLHLEVDDTPPR